MKEATSIDQATLPASQMPVVWTIKEFIKRSKITRTQVYLALKSGELVAHRYGRQNLIFDKDAVAFMNSLPVREAA